MVNTIKLVVCKPFRIFVIVHLRKENDMYKNKDTLMHDLIFKETFANPDNRRQLEKLLELILEYPEGYLKNKLDVHYESPLKKENVRKKSVRGDIIAEFDDTTINIEAFTNFNLNSLDKSLYYVMRIQANKLEIGDGYHKLGKIIQINFVEKSALDLEDEIITNFYLTSERNLKVKILKEKLCVKIVQIDKARELGYTNNELERWLKFIAAKNSDERAEVAKGDELLVKLNKWIQEYVADDKMQEELNKWDLEIAEGKGYEQGIEQNKKEIAKKMLDSHVPIKDISKYTNLSLKEIKGLKEEI